MFNCKNVHSIISFVSKFTKTIVVLFLKTTDIVAFIIIYEMFRYFKIKRKEIFIFYISKSDIFEFICTQSATHD